MVKGTGIKIDDLLKPISEKARCGVDLREDPSPASLYYELQGHRNSARESERNELLSEGSSSDALQHWKKLKQALIKALKTETKDIELCVWLIEALARTDGFKGLSEGFELLDQIVKEFWDSLFPEEDEDGVETKILAMIGLNGTTKDGTLIAPVKTIPITQQSSKGRFNFNKYTAARSTEKIKDEDEKSERIAELGFSMDSIFACVSAGKPDFYLALDSDLTNCIKSFSTLSDNLDNNCGKEAPPTSNIRNCLKEVQSAVKFLARDKLVVEEEADEQESEGDETINKSEGSANNNVGISDRQVALNQLRRVSAYFSREEPHSPIASSIDRVIKWANMPIASLIAELLPAESAQQTYAQLTGVNIGPKGQAKSAVVESVSETSQTNHTNSSNNSEEDGW